MRLAACTWWTPAGRGTGALPGLLLLLGDRQGCAAGTGPGVARKGGGGGPLSDTCVVAVALEPFGSRVVGGSGAMATCVCC